MQTQIQKEVEKILRQKQKQRVDEQLTSLLEQIEDGQKPESMIDWLIMTFGDSIGDIDYPAVLKQKLKTQAFKPLMDELTKECLEKYLITE